MTGIEPVTPSLPRKCSTSEPHHSRGDQILNARSFERQGYSKVLEEESVNAQTLQSAIREVYENRQTYINAMKKSSHTDSIVSRSCDWFELR